MADKTLGTFRIEQDKWEKFKALAASIDSTASAVLVNFIDNCLDANAIPSIPSTSAGIDNLHDVIDKHIAEKLDAIVKERDVARQLTSNHLELSVQRLIDEQKIYHEANQRRLELEIHNLKQQMDELRGKLKAR